MKKLAFALIVAAAVPAGARVLERIAALVDDQVITLSEVDERLALLRQQGVAAQTQIDRKQALEDLVVQKLFDEQMKQLEITVSDRDLEAELDGIRKDNGLDSVGSLKKAVEHQGLSWKDFQEEKRRQLAYYKLIGLKVRSRVKVDEEEVKRRYAEIVASDQGEREVHAAHVLVPLKPEATPAEVEAARVKAESLAAQARKGAEFAKLAAETSDAPSKESGGDLGWFRKGEMVKEIDQLAFSLKVGEIGGPVRSRFGWHVVKVIESRPVTPRPFAEMADAIREKLNREGVDRETKKYLADLKKAAVIEYRMPELRPDGATG